MFPEWMTAIWLRLKALVYRRRLERDLDDELEFHLAMREQKLVEQGMPPEEARYAARRAFGNQTQARESNRELWTFPFLETLAQDLRYGLRQLRRNPGFTAVAVLTLALGIGGTTSVFTIINRTILHALPFPNSDRLMVIGGAASPPTGDRLKWWSQASAFKELALYGSGTMGLTTGARTGQVSTSIVSATLFSTFGVEPRLGRGFTENEDTVPGEGQVAIVSYRFWAKVFGHASFEEGRSINLDGRSYTVIGVIAEGFHFPHDTDVWLPRAAGLHTGGKASSETPFPLHPTVMIGRLRDGASVGLARAQLYSLLQRLTDLYTARTGTHFGDMIFVAPLRDVLVHNFQPALEIIFAAALFLMLIACANAGNLFLARSAAREKETAVRLCLGASRSRVARLMAVEGILLALAAGGISALIAYFVLSSVRSFGPSNIPGLGETRLDLTTTAFSFCLAAAVGLALGAICGIRNATAGSSLALHDGGFMSVGGLRRRVRNILVVAQVAIALILLSAGALMLRSFIRLTRVDPGFNPENLVAMDVAESFSRMSGLVRRPEPKVPNAPMRDHSGPEEKQVEKETAQQLASTQAAYRQAMRLVDTAPGVIACGMVNSLPLGGETGGYIYFDIKGKVAVGEGLYSLVYGDYFRAMGIPLLRGRPFGESDGPAAPKVIIVSQTFAKRLLQKSDPVGEIVTLGGESTGRRIVGLVGDVKFQSLGELPQAEFYLPYGQPYRDQAAPPHATLVVRTGQPPAAIIPTVRDRVRDAGQGLLVLDSRSMSDLIAEASAPQGFRSLIIGCFAALGILLAVLGVYALVSYTTAHRTHEFAIRAAFGARQSHILLLVLWQGTGLVLAGILVGLIGALWLTRAISGLLFGISPTDPKTLAFSAGLLFFTSVAACLLPARRAAKVDPMVALRYE
jgi:putative ABC transport system permease protein